MPNSNIDKIARIKDKDLVTLSTFIQENSESGNGISWPESDNKVYVVKNGAFVEATIVAQPSEWAADIDDTQDIVLTVDQDMIPYQLTGNNVEVNTGE